MNIYEGNDLRDAGIYYYYRKNFQPTENQPMPSPSASFYTFFNHSYSYNLVNSFWKFFRHASDAPAKSDRNPFTISLEDNRINFKYHLVFADKTISFNPQNSDTDEVVVAKYLRNQQIEAGIFTAIEEALVTFVELSKEHHFVPIVTYTPATHTAYESKVVFENSDLSELMSWFSHQQRAYFQKKGTELGYTFIDLTPALQAGAKTNSSENLLYYRKDLHLTSDGHTVIAQVISQLLHDILKN